MKRLYKKFGYLPLLFVAVLLLTSCATVTPIEECVTETPLGFWKGLLHGVITPFSFIVSLFKDDVAIYAINNNEGWYDFGFLLGASIVFGGSGSRARKC